MPTNSVAVSTAEAKAAEYDAARTCLIFSNPDTAENIYVSDQPGVGTKGVVIGPTMTVVLTGRDGWDVKAAHYAYCAAAKTLNVGTGSIAVWASGETPPDGGDGLPHKKDPPM